MHRQVTETSASLNNRELRYVFIFLMTLTLQLWSCFVFLTVNKEHIDRKVKTAFNEEGCSVNIGTICTGTESLCTWRCMRNKKCRAPFTGCELWFCFVVSARAHLRSFLEEKPLQGFRELAEGGKYPWVYSSSVYFFLLLSNYFDLEIIMLFSGMDSQIWSDL